MKKTQQLRTISQIIFFILSFFAFFYNFKGFMIFILALSLIAGVFYCGWICPFGFIQDTVNKLSSILKIKKITPPAHIQKYLVYSRYLITILAIAGLSILVSADPRHTMLNLMKQQQVQIVTITIMIIFITAALFIERFFCNYFCNDGAKMGLLSLARIITIHRDNNTCVDCKKCDNSCPMNITISNKNTLRNAQCINCFKCISNCPVSGTLKYKAVKPKNLFNKNSAV